FCPVIAVTWSTPISMILAFETASPRPMFTVTFITRGTSIGFLKLNCFMSAGITSARYLSRNRGGSFSSGPRVSARSAACFAAAAFLALAAAAAALALAPASPPPAAFAPPAGFGDFSAAFFFLSSAMAQSLSDRLVPDDLAALHRDTDLGPVVLGPGPHPGALARLGVHGHHLRLVDGPLALHDP